MSLIDPGLAAILVCPVDRGHLSENSETAHLVCDQCGREYPVLDGIPVMLIPDVDKETNDD
ncbi:MAG: Trm112 family protein [Acidimicrobiia bacterium]